MIDVLIEIKELLKDVDVKSLKIGLEPNLSPSDYPIIRIVSTQNSLTNSHGWYENLSLDIFCGYKLDSKIGLEVIYKKLYELEREIKFKLHNKELSNGLMKFLSTRTDEDTLPNFKVLCMSFEVLGVKLKD